MSVNYNTSQKTSNLQLCLDVNNVKSYSGSGSVWNNLVSNTAFTGADAAWANNIYTMTMIIVIEKTGNLTGYATHPINKWNTGTGNTSFVIYHFGSTGGEGNISVYYTANSTWTGQFVTTLTVGQKAHIAFQWNSSLGGQVWLNGNKVGARASSGVLGVAGASGIGISGPLSDTHSRVHYAAFYNKELTDLEISKNYFSIGKRFGI